MNIMEFLEVPWFDDDVYKLLVRFTINLFFLALILVLAIYRIQRQKDFAFTAVMMNVTVFFICFSLKKLDLGLGMALGLFAIFGVLRYRTDAIGIKEMTYLFIVIGIAVINALSNKSTSYAEVAIINTLILGAAIVKERIAGMHSFPDANDKPESKVKKEPKEVEAKADKLPKCTIAYDRLDLLGAASKDQLLEDLRQRTGLNISRVQVQHIDLPSQAATLCIWCQELPA